MIPFLKQVADHYYNKGNVENRCFIFPNRRSMAFFKKYLTEAVRATGPDAVPVISPKMITVNDFFYTVSGVQQADRLTLLLELYDCYAELNPKAEPLDEFIFWGDVILGDFNDVDKYLVDAKQLFANVADFKALQDTFSYLTETQRKAIESFVSHFKDYQGQAVIDADNPKVKERFLLVWNILYKLYESFNERLLSKGLAYEGMAYRHLAMRLSSESVEDVLDSKEDFVFVGLNALNECEKVLMRRLRDCSRAEFCWDWSGKLIRDPQNRSSFFMSRNVDEFPQAAEWAGRESDYPEVNVISVPSSTGQAKLLPEILSDVDKQDCAVVLPDENLLKSVLNSIPEQLADINVTMGLPMSGSLLFAMMADVASIQLHIINRKGDWMFYHRQVNDLFSNPLFKAAMDEQSREIVRNVKKEAKYYIPVEDLRGSKLMDAVFIPVVTDVKSRDKTQTDALAEYLKNVIRTVAPSVGNDPEKAVELEYAKEYYRSINVLQTHGLDVLPATYIRLLSQMIGAVSVPFRGEPLKGLQIMGPLEMRALDFSNLIIMSSNEGVFPRRSVSSSFIPPELRKGFGLPTYEYQDAVWAYYFYRAISRAEKVWMLLDSRTEGVKSGEESRYIKQLEYHFGVPLNRYVVKPSGMASTELTDVEKTAEDVEKIKSTVLSATTLQNYLSCPARFYYSVVKELKAEAEVAESLDNATLGTVYHDTMRAIYTSETAMREDFFFDEKGENERRLTDRLTRISKAYLQSWIEREDQIRAKVKALIVSQLKSVDVGGRNLVVADVIVQYVIMTLKRDIEILGDRDSFEMIGKEMRIWGGFNGQRFKGFIDRIDSIEPGQVRVVDYKTGMVYKDDEEITDDNAIAIADKIFAPDVKERPKIALQFFLYDLLLEDKEIVKGKTLCNSVYSTANLFKKPPQTNPVNKVFYEAMKERLSSLLEEMYNLEVPFRRTTDETVCSYCDFRNICGK